MPFLTDAELKGRVAGNQKTDPASLPAFWDLVIPPANAKAWGNVRRALLDRGYSQAQIDAWDDGPEFQGDLGLYWCLVDSKAAEAYDPLAKPTLDKLDRRGELATVPVTNGGVLVEPADAGSQSPVGHGKMSSVGDLFDCGRTGRPWNCRPRW